jgi:hypothetical protein
MIVDFVLYLLKQGVYSGKGDIAVLCAYLGQFQKVRAALRNVKLAVTVDERDELALERQGLVAEDAFESVDVAKIVSENFLEICHLMHPFPERYDLEQLTLFKEKKQK